MINLLLGFWVVPQPERFHTEYTEKKSSSTGSASIFLWPKLFNWKHYPVLLTS